MAKSFQYSKGLLTQMLRFSALCSYYLDTTTRYTHSSTSRQSPIKLIPRFSYAKVFYHLVFTYYGSVALL